MRMRQLLIGRTCRRRNEVEGSKCSAQEGIHGSTNDDYLVTKSKKGIDASYEKGFRQRIIQRWSIGSAFLLSLWHFTSSFSYSPVGVSFTSCLYEWWTIVYFELDSSSQIYHHIA